MAPYVWRMRVARTLRRYPWVVPAMRRVWKVTRPRFTMGVAGVVFNAEGQVLLVEHVFHPYVPWGLPGGWVERREDPAATLRRELHEELALSVEVGPVVAAEYLGHAHVDLAYLCYATGIVGALNFELLDYRWIDPDDLPHTHNFHRTAIQRARQIVLEDARI